MSNELFCRNFEKERGFTLLEVMIALSIQAIGILAIISMHISASQANAHAVTFTNALLAAQSRIEYLLMEDFDNITSSTTYVVETHEDSSVIPPGYTLEWKAEDHTADMKKINVRVKKIAQTWRQNSRKGAGFDGCKKQRIEV